jgi:glutaminase
MTGTTNHALRSLMLANKAFPTKDTFEATKKLADDGLDWYFAQCSMLASVESIARFGAMLANNGINPSTGERIIEPLTVKATVTIMQTCGMYNGAGKFTRDHGVPSKSGVSGGLLTVIPGIGAVGSFSPLLNEEGNCVRGIGMIEKLNEIYLNFNLFYNDSKKKDLIRRANQTLVWTVIAGINSAASGDIESISRLIVKGLNINDTDYDSRTPLHLAAQAGHVELV